MNYWNIVIGAGIGAGAAGGFLLFVGLMVWVDERFGEGTALFAGITLAATVTGGIIGALP